MKVTNIGHTKLVMSQPCTWWAPQSSYKLYCTYICDIWLDFKNKASWLTVHILQHIMTSELLLTVWNGHDLVWFRLRNWQQEEIVLVKLIFESHLQPFRYRHADHPSVGIWQIGDETKNLIFSQMRPSSMKPLLHDRTRSPDERPRLWPGQPPQRSDAAGVTTALNLEAQGHW